VGLLLGGFVENRLVEGAKKFGFLENKKWR
jgi:hypothetical protein